MRLSARLLLLCGLVMFATLVSAQEASWSTSVSYVRFKPDMAHWRQAYDEDMQGVEIRVAYSPVTILDVGVALGHYSASGQGLLPLNNSYGGKVDYTLYPLEPYVFLHGRFSPNQWLTPYIGGGFSQVYYRVDSREQASRKGKAHGSHYRAGISFALNQYDKAASQRMSSAWGIVSTSLNLEVKELTAEKDDVDLGGRMYLLGLTFVF